MFFKHWNVANVTEPGVSSGVESIQIVNNSEDIKTPKSSIEQGKRFGLDMKRFCNVIVGGQEQFIHGLYLASVFRLTRRFLPFRNAFGLNRERGQFRRSLATVCDNAFYINKISTQELSRHLASFYVMSDRYGNPSALTVSSGSDLNGDPESQKDREQGDYERGDCVEFVNPIMRLLLGIGLLGTALLFGWLNVNGFVSYDGWQRWLRALGFTILGGLALWGLFAMIFGRWNWYEPCGNDEAQHQSFHGPDSVSQKYLKKGLTNPSSCNTLISGRGEKLMANILEKDKQIAIIGALAEGSSIRSIERMSGVHRDTIMRLGVKVGKGCAALLNYKMRNLSCQSLQVDELWGFIGKKERHVQPADDPQYGDVWTFCAIDADTKLVPSFKVGKRNAATANAFVSDVASRLKNRVQLSSDALRAYVEAVELAFGADVDYAQIIKTYGPDEVQGPERKYSPSEFVSVEKHRIMGTPDMGLASTSYIERLNGTTRLHMRRLTRLTYAFSKKLENFEAAVALHFAYYNFVKRHLTLRCTPAMAAGLEKDFCTVEDLVDAA
jgi:IS1 family transposase